MAEAKPRILLIEPFFGGSHQRWATELQQHLPYEVDLLTLPARHWKWRMHGAAITLANKLLEEQLKPNLILATDMLDLNVFLSLTRKQTADVPVIFYFHENQLTYPWSDQDRDKKNQRNHHYGFINYASALAADAIWFNSHYHRQIFLQELPRFLKMFPDYQHLSNADKIAEKSKVIPIGTDRQKLSAHQHSERSGEPLILWNHRWEYDKNPEDFFELMHHLDAQGLAFRLAILGERAEKYPPLFDTIRESLAHRIDHWGYAASEAEYIHWLWKADYLPVTSKQDFFGISAVEAMACETFPMLPDRLAFSEHLRGSYCDTHLYQNKEELFRKMEDLLKGKKQIFDPDKASFVPEYDWPRVVKTLQSELDAWL